MHLQQRLSLGPVRHLLKGFFLKLIHGSWPAFSTFEIQKKRHAPALSGLAPPTQLMMDAFSPVLGVDRDKAAVKKNVIDDLQDATDQEWA